jgi:hypothetical protein
MREICRIVAMFAIVDFPAVFRKQSLLSLWFIPVPISCTSSNRLLVIFIARRDNENVAWPQLVILRK